jgi:phosphoglycolate phosphatase-like HAD superfamily hydrolase
MLEIVRPGAAAPGARAALFDFDGTLSLIRAGWLDIMLNMMTGTLAALGTGESAEHLRAESLDRIWPQTGRDTLFQMIEFAAMIEARGGTAEEPHVYKQRFLDELFEISGRRIGDVREGRALADQYLVPGSRALLEDLRVRGLTLYLASGTDHDRLGYEAGVLDIAHYFDGGIYGALPDPEAFSKGMLIARIAAAPGMHASMLIGFGDGPTEIGEIHRAGALAVGVASDEPECRNVSPFKRASLIEHGADYIIPNYLCRQALLPLVFSDNHGSEHEPV